AAALLLRSSRSATRETRVSRGDPLLITDRLGDGFLEVDWNGERWFALETSLEPWRGDSPAAAQMAGRFGAAAAASRATPQPPIPPAPQAVAGAYRAPGPTTLGLRNPLPIPLLPVFIVACAVLVLIGSFSTWATVLG